MTAGRQPLSLFTGLVQAFVGLGALPVGLLMILNPRGGRLVPAEVLEGSPFPDFLIPGLFLFTVNGLGSLIGAYLSFRRHRLAGPAALGLGAFLMAWIVVQVLALGPPIVFLQGMYFVLGAVELAAGWRIGPGGPGRRLRGGGAPPAPGEPSERPT